MASAASRPTTMAVCTSRPIDRSLSGWPTKDARPNTITSAKGAARTVTPSTRINVSSIERLLGNFGAVAMRVGFFDHRKTQMATPAAIPIRGTSHRRQFGLLRLMFLPLPIAIDLDFVRVRVEYGELGPAVAQNLSDQLVAVHDRVHRLGRGLDDEQQPQRLVDFDALPRQAG